MPIHASSPLCWDHPRGCGEHPLVQNVRVGQIGSSPRMRGAPHACDRIRRWWRIIPADAGSTFGGQPNHERLRDHPRGCGEHQISTAAEFLALGSSPRMRGAREVPQVLLTPIRIIPADAGSTRNPAFVYPAFRDHPRGCGEHLFAASWQSAAGGSSPRMRGAPTGYHPCGRPEGIIPADAGSTIANVLKKNDIRDHPRGCGEHEHLAVLLHSVGGSSPRMRGALRGRQRRGPEAGIIPADAGSTEAKNQAVY